MTDRARGRFYDPQALTREEFAELLEGAECPAQHLPGMVERDRLVLLALLLTGMRPTELIAVRWADLDLGWPRPSLLIPSVKGTRCRRQPLPRQELRDWREFRWPARTETVFCGLTGARLRTSKLERVIGRAADRVDLNKHVTAHILRNTAATWLKQAGASRWLIARYPGEADSPTGQYANDEREDLRVALQCLADHAIEDRDLAIDRNDSVRPPRADWPFGPRLGQ